MDKRVTPSLTYHNTDGLLYPNLQISDEWR